jgi:hypothetical protein
MNDLPKTLVAFDKSYGKIILAFDDKTVIKLVSNCDEGDCWLCEAALTDQEKFEYGLMGQDELTRIRLQENSDRTRKYIDGKLVVAWKNFHAHGPKYGFPQPTSLPGYVADAFSSTDWSQIDGDRTLMTYRGINFVNKRPLEE